MNESYEQSWQRYRRYRARRSASKAEYHRRVKARVRARRGR